MPEYLQGPQRWLHKNLKFSNSSQAASFYAPPLSDAWNEDGLVGAIHKELRPSVHACLDTSSVFHPNKGTNNCRINCLRCGWGSKLGQAALSVTLSGLWKSPLRSTPLSLWGLWWPLSEWILKLWRARWKIQQFYTRQKGACVGGPPSQPQLPAFCHFLPRFTIIAQRY